MTGKVYEGDLLLEAIAARCHEVNLAFCESLGDFSQVPWEMAPQWQRDSAIAGVKFHLENPDASASASHDSWMKQKLEDGWVHGPVKDVEKKQHPCIVPFGQLPLAQQVKDHLFKATVHSMKWMSDYCRFGATEKRCVSCQHREPMSIGLSTCHRCVEMGGQADGQ